MKRREALQTLAAAAAALPLMSAEISALELATEQELQPDQLFVLRDVAATVLPSAIGTRGQEEAVANFLRWLRFDPASLARRPWCSPVDPCVRPA